MYSMTTHGGGDTGSVYCLAEVNVTIVHMPVHHGPDRIAELGMSCAFVPCVYALVDRGLNGRYPSVDRRRKSTHALAASVRTRL